MNSNEHAESDLLSRMTFGGLLEIAGGFLNKEIYPYMMQFKSFFPSFPIFTLYITQVITWANFFGALKEPSSV